MDYEADTKLITLDIKVKTGASGNTVVDLDGHLLHDIEDTIFVSLMLLKSNNYLIMKYFNVPYLFVYIKQFHQRRFK